MTPPSVPFISFWLFIFPCCLLKLIDRDTIYWKISPIQFLFLKIDQSYWEITHNFVLKNKLNILYLFGHQESVKSKSKSEVLSCLTQLEVRWNLCRFCWTRPNFITHWKNKITREFGGNHLLNTNTCFMLSWTRLQIHLDLGLIHPLHDA